MAGFLTGQTVIGMIIKVKPQQVLPGFNDFLGFSMDYHAVFHQGGTARLQSVMAVDFDEAHPAGSVDGKIFIITKGRDVKPVVIANFN